MLISFSWFVLFDSCPKHPGIGCKMCKFTWFFLSSLSSEYITKCEKRNSNFPPLRHLRDTQRSWSFTTRNLVSINQIVLRILLQISLFEPHSLNISCLSVFFSSFFFSGAILISLSSAVSMLNSNFYYVSFLLLYIQKNQPVSKSYSILSLNSPRIWPLLTTLQCQHSVHWTYPPSLLQTS